MTKLILAIALAAVAGIAGAQAQNFPARPVTVIVPFPPGGQVDLMVVQAAVTLPQALADPAIRTRFADLGLDVASREQQVPEGLAAFHKAEIEKWWPIIKAAGIKVE